VKKVTFYNQIQQSWEGFWHRRWLENHRRKFARVPFGLTTVQAHEHQYKHFWFDYDKFIGDMKNIYLPHMIKVNRSMDPLELATIFVPEVVEEKLKENKHIWVEDEEYKQYYGEDLGSMHRDILPTLGLVWVKMRHARVYLEEPSGILRCNMKCRISENVTPRDKWGRSRAIGGSHEDVKLWFQYKLCWAFNEAKNHWEIDYIKHRRIRGGTKRLYGLHWIRRYWHSFKNP